MIIFNTCYIKKLKHTRLTWCKGTLQWLYQQKKKALWVKQSVGGDIWWEERSSNNGVSNDEKKSNSVVTMKWMYQKSKTTLGDTWTMFALREKMSIRRTRGWEWGWEFWITWVFTNYNQITIRDY